MLALTTIPTYPMLHYTKLTRLWVSSTTTSSIFSIYCIDNNDRIVQRKNPRKKFLYIAMMSADKFIQTRVKAAVQTWASSLRTWNRQANVEVEIFAQSNETIGVPIVQMPGISDNVYPPQKVCRFVIYCFFISFS